MSEVRIEYGDSRATLVLDNEGRRNAMDVALLRSLEAGARALAREDSVKVVVLRGAGERAFCSGADLDALCVPPIEASVAQMDVLLGSALDALAAIEVPVIAAIQGACIGGGVQLALAADIRLASDEARFAIPAAQAGLPYPFDALRKIVALMGEGRAKAFLLGLQTLDARAALDAGLIDAVAAAKEFEGTLSALADGMVRLPRESAIAYKRMLTAVAIGDFALAARSHADLRTKGLYVDALAAMAKRRAAERERGPRT